MELVGTEKTKDWEGKKAYITCVDARIQVLYKNVARLHRRLVRYSHNSGRRSKI